VHGNGRGVDLGRLSGTIRTAALSETKTSSNIALNEPHEGERDMTEKIDRREFLRRSAGSSMAIVALGGGGALAALPKHTSTTKPAPELAPLTFQLGWVKNAEWSGEYIADSRGYYKAAGFRSVTLLAGGPTAPPIESVVTAGKALSGVSSPNITASAIQQGAPVKTVAVQYQKNPYVIMSLASNPIRTPQEMIGKTIGIPTGEAALFAAFLKVNHINPGKVHTVPVSFDPSDLPNHQVDGRVAFLTNEPIALAAQGVHTYTFLFADHNYPLVNNNYVVTDRALAKNREAVKAMLRAEIQGWQRSLADPELGPRLDVTNYGSTLGLTLTSAIEQSKAQNELIVSPATRKNGIFTMTPELIDENMRLLALGGVKLPASNLWDFSVLEEVYQEDPALR